MSERLLTIYVTDSSGAQVNDPLLEYAGRVTFRTQYPAGLYASAQFTLPYTATSKAPALRSGYNVAINDGPRVVWEGVVDSVDAQGEEGARVECVGYWAAYFERRGIDRRWADNRLTSNALVWNSGANAANLARHNASDGELRIVANRSDEWPAASSYHVDYTMPTSETVGYITFDYDFFEPAGQNWVQRIYDYDTPTSLWSVATTSTGSTTITPAAPPQTIAFDLVSNATQTPSDTCQARFLNMMIYASRDHASATLGNVSAYEVALDIVDRLAVDETLISAELTDISTALTLSVKPFITNGRESYATVISRVTGYGDSSENSIGYGLRRAQLANDNRPRMFLETYPALTDYDYEITVEDGDVRVRENADDIWNWISVKYRSSGGVNAIVTPDDDANLTDATSVSKYGRREIVISLSEATATTAANYGRRYLDRHKDPTWAVSAPVRVTEILSKAGGIIPGSQIEAGKRLRIADLPDRPNSGILGVNFIIVSTDYDNDSGVCSISLGGTPDDLSVYLAQLALGNAN